MTRSLVKRNVNPTINRLAWRCLSAHYVCRSLEAWLLLITQPKALYSHSDAISREHVVRIVGALYDLCVPNRKRRPMIAFPIFTVSCCSNML